MQESVNAQRRAAEIEQQRAQALAQAQAQAQAQAALEAKADAAALEATVLERVAGIRARQAAAKQPKPAR